MADAALAEEIKKRFPNVVHETGIFSENPFIRLKKEGLKSVMAALKDDPSFSFNVLMDLTAVDYLFWEEKEFRFEVVYNLFSLPKNRRLFVKAPVPEADATIDSVTSLWPAANWFEREVWDLFGIRFKGHPDPRRILMYEEFKGHPLRKDYRYNQRQPLIGPVN